MSRNQIIANSLNTEELNLLNQILEGKINSSEVTSPIVKFALEFYTPEYLPSEEEFFQTTPEDISRLELQFV
jgi:hypothetical protein